MKPVRSFDSYIEAKLWRMAQERPTAYIIVPPGRVDHRYTVLGPALTRGATQS